ncbi:MAG: cytochrome P450 [Myxococcales bacterium]|nr:cytochrome P450 [Myxococcales bacterium]
MIASLPLPVPPDAREVFGGLASGAAKEQSAGMGEPRLRPDFDALAPETFDSPYPLYRELRARCPVARSDAWGGFWAFMRYEDVSQAAADAKRFTTTVQNVVPKVAFTGRRPPLHFDPPEHTPYRRALNPLFSSERMQSLEEPILAISQRLLAPLIAQGRGDICLDFSTHLPIQVFALWMNLEDRDAAALATVGRAFNVAVQANLDEQVKATSLQLYALAREVLARRRAEPLDPTLDPTCALLAARDDQGRPLPEDLLIGCIRQVLVVGIIAPTVLIGSIAIHLARDQALQQRLRAEPHLIPTALEEFLRLYTPYRGFARTATAPMVCHGRDIRPREPIALVYASANRDEAQFAGGDCFQLDRPNIAQHLAFGRGAHRCPGAPLGRLQLRLALEVLLRDTRRFHLAGPIVPTRCPEIGARSVPLSLEPA